MPPDQGIVTVCDANYFPGLLMLHKSVQESHPCTIACYDLGCTEEQRKVAAALVDLILLPLPQDPLIERIQSAMGKAPPLMKANKRVWPLWICPLLIKHAPFRDVIWMDCDLVVLRRLSDLFALIDTGPVFTPENKAPHLTPNRPELYRLLPIHRPFDSSSPAINAGVSGWRKGRDNAAIDAYILPVERAIDDENVRTSISWHDQGALIWAIQHCGLEARVVDSPVWNQCVDNTSIRDEPIAWDESFLDEIRRRLPQTNIVHWNGRNPPWTGHSGRNAPRPSTALPESM